MIQHLKTGPMNFPDVFGHFDRDNRPSRIQTNSECFNVKQTSESITLFSDSLDTIKVLSMISSVLTIAWRSILDNTHIDMVFPFPIKYASLIENSHNRPSIIPHTCFENSTYHFDPS